LYVDEQRVDGTLGHAGLDRQVAADARRLLPRGQCRSFLYELADGDELGRIVRDRQGVVQERNAPGRVQVYIETHVPPPALVVFGAGHDALPVVELAARVGFRVTVVDSRPAYARPERFPQAAHVIHAHPEDVPSRVAMDPDTFVVVMTHNFRQDAAILQQIWGQPYAYLGVLGPWERTARLLNDLRAAGHSVEQHLDRLYAPVGLDIGAEGPEQIALAIVAELLAVRWGAGGGFLRFHKGSLHQRRRGAGGLDGEEA